MLITISLIVFTLGLAFVLNKKCFSSWADSKNKKYKGFVGFFANDHITSYAVGIITTILGVTLAIMITTNVAHKQDVDKAITLIEILDRELKMVEDNIDEFYLPMYDNLKGQNTPEKFVVLIKNSPVTPIMSFSIMLSNELFITNLNSFSLYALIDSKRSFDATYDRLGEATELDRIVFEINTLRSDIEFARQLIDNEINYLNEDIAADEMESKVNEIYEKHFTSK